jgi:hypothetical protein
MRDRPGTAPPHNQRFPEGSRIISQRRYRPDPRYHYFFHVPVDLTNWRKITYLPASKEN